LDHDGGGDGQKVLFRKASLQASAGKKPKKVGQYKGRRIGAGVLLTKKPWDGGKKQKKNDKMRKGWGLLYGLGEEKEKFKQKPAN